MTQPNQPMPPACPACTVQPYEPDLGGHHAHVTDYGYVLYDPQHRQDLPGGLIAEGRRQATDGWDREWGAQYRNDSWVQATFDSEAEAVEFAAGAIGHRAVSRLVSPWEPTDPPHVHCGHWQEGDGDCHGCGAPNWCPDEGVTPENEQALRSAWAADPGAQGPWKPAEPGTIGSCPLCGKPITAFDGEPVDEVPDSAGFREIWTISRCYEPCGCSEIRDVRPRDEDRDGTR